MTKSPRSKPVYKSIELFAGAGGLIIGAERAGVESLLVVEFNRRACETLRANQARGIILSNAEILEEDVRTVDFKRFKDLVDIVSGGPPCQPFSLGGKSRGFNDTRDMFPQAIRAVRETNPKAFLFENVKGLLRSGFSAYFEYVILGLQYPSIALNAEENWEDHRTRLQAHAKKQTGPEYVVVYKLFNAANYGVPQKRERVIIVGIRVDLGVTFEFPAETHSAAALCASQTVTGAYWDKHKLPKSPKKDAKDPVGDGLKPWKTVRDALKELASSKRIGADAASTSTAKIYPGHTGSTLDQPSKTIKAGDHGVPGGENMVIQDDGVARYLTAREAAKLQTFPDDYILAGKWGDALKQIGNAVPCDLAEAVFSKLADTLTAVAGNRRGSGGDGR